MDRFAWVLWVSISAGSLLPARVAAQEFQLDGAGQGLVTTGLWTSALFLEGQKAAWSGVSPCGGRAEAPSLRDLELYEALPVHGGTCDRQRIFGPDRPFLGARAEWAARGSDLLLLGAMSAPLVYAGARSLPPDTSRLEGASADALVTFQVLGATWLVTNAVKFAVRRPRPLTFDGRIPKEKRFSGDARLSFPSGHTSLAFASASVLTLMVTERSDDAALQAGAALGAYGVATLIGSFRVISDRHFLTDVLAGAALGTGLGWLIPQAHLDHSGNAMGAGGNQ